MTFSSASDHQRKLLTAHLRRLMPIEESLARKPGDVNLALEREHTLAGVEQTAAQLGLGTFQQNLAAIVDAVGLRAAFITSLQRQQQYLTAYRQAAELQRISADAITQIDLDQALHNAGERLDQIAQQLASLGTASTPNA